MYLFLNMIYFQSFNEYYSAEHGRLLALWRAVVNFRREYGEMKAHAERDMGHLRSDVARVSRNMHSAFLNFGANQRSNDTQSQVRLMTIFPKQNG